MPAANDVTLSQNPDDPLDELIARYLVQVEAGDAPDREAFIAANPQFADALREFFAAQDAVAGHASTAPHPATDRRPRIRYIGDYELLEEIARGGMGVVFKARQLSVGRFVALKMLLSGTYASDSEKRRFQAETEAAANLDHPNIVPIYEIGEFEAQPYFAMRYLDGPTLKLVPRATPRQEAERLVKIARAVHFAHQRGILHRDLKPGNILSDAAGEPYVTDFGLARRMDAEESFTQTGAILGTPAYMAPEQAAGKKAISLAADIFALGVILFERLTGKLPFQGDSQQELLRQVREQEPARLSSITPGLPRDLETICLKCLRKEPGERYASAADFADDLNRYLSGHAILARPVGNVERAVKWVKRNPMVTGLTAAVFVVMALGTVVSYVKFMDAKANESAANEATAKAVFQEGLAVGNAKSTQQALKIVSDREADLKYNLGNTHMMLANLAYENRDVVLAQELLDKVPFEQRKFEWGYRRRQVMGGLFTLYGHKSEVVSVAFRPDGRQIVTGSWDTTAIIWDARTGQPLLDLKGHESVVTSVAFSSDGQRIVTGCADKLAKVWDARTARSLLDLEGHTDWVNCVAFSPDGQRVATGSSDKTAKVWDSRSGKGLLDLKGHTETVTSLAFSSDGKQIVTGSMDDTAIVWDAITGQALLELKGHSFFVRGVAFSPDCQRIATVSDDQTVRIWDAHVGHNLLHLNGLTDTFTSVTFSPDGRRIVAGSEGKTARVWDAQTGQVLLDLKGHTGKVTSVAFSPDGGTIVTGSHDSTAKLWDARTGQPSLELKGLTDRVYSVAFSPDGERIVTGNFDNSAKVWHARTGQALFELKGHTGFVDSVDFSSDGRRIVTGSYDNTAKVWDANTGHLLLELKGLDDRLKDASGPADWLRCVAFSPDCQSIVTGGNKIVQIWNARTGIAMRNFQHRDWVFSVAFSPDGQRIVIGSSDHKTEVLDAGTGLVLFGLTGHHGLVWSVAFSADGQRIVTGGSDQTAKVWEARTGQVLLELKGHTGGVHCVKFSPDGKRIVTGSDDHTARVWDAHSGQSLLDLKGHNSNVKCVAFSPDGQRIVTGSLNETAKIWDAQIDQVPLNLKGHTDNVMAVAFSQDCRHIVTGSRDKIAKVWDALTGRTILDLKGHTDSVSSVAFSLDGQQIVTGSSDKTAKIWDSRTGQARLDLKGHTHSVSSVAFSPDGQQIVTGSSDKTAKIWDAQTGQVLFDLRGHKDELHCVAFSPDGQKVVTGSSDKTAKVWDARTGQALFELTGHTHIIMSVAFSPDSQRVIATTWDRVAKVWNAQTGQELSELSSPLAIPIGEHSPDQRIAAIIRGNHVSLIRLELPAFELESHLSWTAPNSSRAYDRFQSIDEATKPFAKRFYTDRMLSFREYSAESEWLNYRSQLTGDPRHTARAGFHTPAVADTKYDPENLRLLAAAGDRLAQRLVAQEFIRDGKPEKAVALLTWCLASRPLNAPPVEELLIAKAFWKMRRPDDAKNYYRAATKWLDRPRDPMRAANVITAAAVNPWAMIGELHKPVDDPRHNTFDWESWYECDVFRAELEKQLRTNK